MSSLNIINLGIFDTKIDMTEGASSVEAYS